MVLTTIGVHMTTKSGQIQDRQHLRRSRPTGRANFETRPALADPPALSDRSDEFWSDALASGARGRKPIGVHIPASADHSNLLWSSACDDQPTKGCVCLQPLCDDSVKVPPEVFRDFWLAFAHLLGRGVESLSAVRGVGVAVRGTPNWRSNARQTHDGSVPRPRPPCRRRTLILRVAIHGGPVTATRARRLESVRRRQAPPSKRGVGNE